jgi:hypothetical protein
VSRDDVRHGTSAGYDVHHRRGESPCDACRLAKKEYDARWRAASPVARRNRLHARARNRALTRLARRHPAEYRALYLDEKSRETDELA